MNFRLGENIGDILLGISQEALKKGNIEKTYSTYLESLPGFPRDLVIDILKGEVHIKTTPDHLSVELVDGKDPNASYYDWSSLLSETIEEIYSCRETLLNLIGSKSFEYDVDFSDTSEPSYNMVVRIIEGESNEIHERLYDHIKYNVEVAEDYSSSDKLLYDTVEYCDSIKVLLSILENHLTVYKFLKENKFKVDHIPFYSSTIEGSVWLLSEFKDRFNIKHLGIKEYLLGLKNKITTVLGSFEITKEYIDKGILESDILDGYNAGWISPEGKFYGGIGRASDMLHRNLAEKILRNNRYDAESKLEKEGWIKIHDNVIFGCFSKGYFPTDIQVKKICEYVDKFYKGVFWKEPEILRTSEPIHTSKLKQMDKFNLKEALTI